MAHRLMLLALLPLGVFLAGCPAPARVVSFTDPEFVNVSYQRIAVFADSRDLQVRRSVETQFARELGELGVRAAPTMEIILPTRRYTEQEMIEKMRENQFNGLLVIMHVDTLVEEVFVPPQFTPGIGFGVGTFGPTAFGGATFRPGATYTRVREVRFDVRLIDIRTGETAWVSTVIAPPRRDIQHIAEQTVRRLQRDGLLEPANRL